MVSTHQVIKGLTKYIDSDMLPKLTGSRYWVMAVVSGMAVKSAERIMCELQKQPVVNALGLISDNGEVDIDQMYQILRRAAEKTPAEIEIPMVGKYKLEKNDVDLIYRLIKES